METDENTTKIEIKHVTKETKTTVVKEVTTTITTEVLNTRADNGDTGIQFYIILSVMA